MQLMKITEIEYNLGVEDPFAYSEESFPFQLFYYVPSGPNLKLKQTLNCSDRSHS